MDTKLIALVNFQKMFRIQKMLQRVRGRERGGRERWEREGARWTVGDRGGIDRGGRDRSGREIEGESRKQEEINIFRV